MNILVPLDGSDTSRMVLPAIQAILAQAPDTNVILFGALDARAGDVSTDRPYEDDRPQTAGQWETAPTVPSTPAPRTVETRGQALDRLRAEAEVGLRTVVHEHLPDARAAIHVRWAEDTAAAITGAASELAADMIAMATHGRTGLGRVMMGSVAGEVVRTATVPVLLVRPPDLG